VILFISPHPKRAYFGGSIFSGLLEDALQRLAPTETVRLGEEILDQGTIGGVQRALNNYNFLPHFLNYYLRKISRRPETPAPAAIVIDTSLLGWLVPHVKRRYPQSFVLVISHNDEQEYWRSRQQFSRWVRGLIRKKLHSAEEKICTYADVMSHVSASDLRATVARMSLRSTVRHLILPIASTTAAPNSNMTTALIAAPRYGWVFVGSNFFANRQAVSTLSPIAKEARMRITLVGSVCECDEARDSQLELLGKVPELAPVYEHSYGALVLVDDGSGMKIKIAEALAHGRPAIVSEKAAAGYEAAIEAGVVRVCRFIDVAAVMKDLQENPVSETLCKSVHERNYSAHALASRLCDVLRERML
jgi:hypothetical protein